VPVWTGTTNPGGVSAGGGNCSNWSSSDTGIAVFGDARSTDSAEWTQRCSLPVCASTAALYCVEQ
jgi:hypothetical protein